MERLSDTFIRLMHLISYISAHPNEIPGIIIFPSDPATIAICPTKALEKMVKIIVFGKTMAPTLIFQAEKMKECGLQSLAVNSDTTTMAKQSKGLDLFQDARREVTMILLSSEQLNGSHVKGYWMTRSLGRGFVWWGSMKLT